MKKLVCSLLGATLLLGAVTSSVSAAPAVKMTANVKDTHSFDKKACDGSQCTLEGEWCVLVILTTGAVECREATPPPSDG